jgi:hypothetical protein
VHQEKQCNKNEMFDFIHGLYVDFKWIAIFGSLFNEETLSFLFWGQFPC